MPIVAERLLLNFVYEVEEVEQKKRECGGAMSLSKEMQAPWSLRFWRLAHSTCV